MNADIKSSLPSVTSTDTPYYIQGVSLENHPITLEIKRFGCIRTLGQLSTHDLTNFHELGGSLVGVEIANGDFTYRHPNKHLSFDGAIWLDGRITGCDLTNVSFVGCDLKNVTIDDCFIGENTFKGAINPPDCLTTPTWSTFYNHATDMVSIGCQCHTFDEWMVFDDQRIGDMSCYALEWWALHKGQVVGLVAKVRAREATKHT